MQPEKTLQQYFEEFRKQKQNSLRKIKQNPTPKNRSAEQKQVLREKFLSLLHSHAGVPYCRRNHPSDSDLFNYSYELDCCALVRQALKQMEDELDIKLGLWNQAYFFDVLPLKYECHTQIVPGDLILYIGKYPGEKQQKHNVVHVEVYEGTENKPERCFGSRWNDGVVQYFDSYQFKASTWTLEKIWFCSIDTWLDGVCTSCCEEHPWEIEEGKGIGKKSIFYDASDYTAE
ncbi:Conserved_hypothetical protein [Hexamita inflata]|uniref:NlpC/P60 domain-containing protein n=1 Tax=Hexamita inflata TaxID=28002 RepID=A0AA86QV43_9EUKA|nr:Conserved hypothetical protein [Hexamita inflata]